MPRHHTRHHRQLRLPGALLPACLALGGCSILEPKPDEDVQAEALYQTAKTSLQSGYYSAAIENYRKLETTFPFSRHSQAALLETAYAHYKIEDNETATVMTGRFIKNNPNHPNLDYAYYLQGLAWFNYGRNLLNKIVPRDRTTKDPRPLMESFAAFKHLHENFPESSYHDSAGTHLVVLRNLLAIYEMRVAGFYLRQGSYVAAVNRIKYMLEQYDGAQNTPDALYLMAGAYRRLGADDLTDDTIKVLTHNYPDYLGADMKPVGAPARERRGWMDALNRLADSLLDKLNLKARN